ncbi:hypothetical protein AVEN_163577-1 [Araneus ventricosus]|uniref:Uncharacterized protein n=1 Tax=Araneus ventricosus TaxID=182803 RepID=A0A4Y2W7G3_ARAVE|nr:hypothetical protein AVEN_163577-1 [Araneus ventricosus]
MPSRGPDNKNLRIGLKLLLRPKPIPYLYLAFICQTFREQKPSLLNAKHRPHFLWTRQKSPPPLGKPPRRPGTKPGSARPCLQGRWGKGGEQFLGLRRSRDSCTAHI